MSADNGAYVLKTSKTIPNDGLYEYRVVHTQNIEDIMPESHTDDLWQYYMVWKFADAPVFTNEKEAFEKATEICETIDYVEYGICLIDQSNFVFPSITVEQADKYLTEYWSDSNDER